MFFKIAVLTNFAIFTVKFTRTAFFIEPPVAASDDLL